jgi:hypothetical protein
MACLDIQQSAEVEALAEIIRPLLIGALKEGYGLAAKMAQELAGEMRSGGIPVLPGPEALDLLAEALDRTAAETNGLSTQASLDRTAAGGLGLSGSGNAPARSKTAKNSPTE